MDAASQLALETVLVTLCRYMPRHLLCWSNGQQENNHSSNIACLGLVILKRQESNAC